MQCYERHEQQNRHKKWRRRCLCKRKGLIITDSEEGIFMYPFQGMIFIICPFTRGGASLTPGCLIIALSGRKFSLGWEGIFMYPFQGMIFIICPFTRGGASLTLSCLIIALSGRKFSPRRGLTCQPGVSEAPPPVMNQNCFRSLKGIHTGGSPKIRYNQNIRDKRVCERGDSATDQ